MEIKDRQKVLLIVAVACVLALIGNSLIRLPADQQLEEPGATHFGFKEQRDARAGAH